MSPGVVVNKPSGPMSKKVSLLIWGFPRSFTSKTYDVLVRALRNQLQIPSKALRRNPDFPMNGEILNRSRLFGPDSGRERPAQGILDNEKAYQDGAEVLNMFVGGFLIKSVTQPWIVSRYLDEHPGAFKVLCIRRDLADVLYRMDHHEWYYPTRAACPVHLGETGPCWKSCNRCPVHDKDRLTPLAKGLLAWENLFEPWDSHDVVVDYEAAVSDPDVIYDAVEAVGYRPRRWRWISKPHKRTREKVQAYRETEGWKACRALMDNLRAQAKNHGSCG